MIVDADPLPHHSKCVCAGVGPCGFNGLIGLVGLREGADSGNWFPIAREEQS